MSAERIDVHVAHEMWLAGRTAFTIEGGTND